MTQASPWWAPHVYADRREFLKARQRITRACRSFFDESGFDEVDTAVLQVSPGNEAHLAAFETSLIAGDSSSSTLYLHTSPEFACKKLLAAGEDRIFTFARAFRNRERGPLHHPEFTMLEWYRANEPYERLMDDCASLMARAARAAGTQALVWRGREADPFAEPERLSVSDAFQRYAGIDLLATLADPRIPDRGLLADSAARLGIRIAADDTWSDLFSKVLSLRIEPNLGIGRATILLDYPACEAALARVSAADPRVSERFEFYACGVELANGFGELSDPVEQRRRFEDAMRVRKDRWGEAYPIDEDFLAALTIMPDSSGIALGFDRLVMLAAGAERVEQVLWTPVALAGLQ